MTVQELYETALHTLSLPERLVLASRLLSSVIEPDVDMGEEWSDQDMRDFSAASMRSLDERLWRDGDAGLG